MSSHPLAIGKHHLLNSNQLDIYVFPLFKMYMGACLHVYVCIVCMPDVFRKQKRAQDPPELELQVVVHATWETCTFKPPISILSKELKVKTYLPMLKAA